jgi:DNA replication protein DnaC
MEPITAQANGWIASMRSKLAELEKQTAKAHAEKMASLPPGTCEGCYGHGCRTCNPPEFHALGVPHEFKSATLSNFREDLGNRSALAKAQSFLTGTRDLYLCGGVGAGKSRLACSILNTHYRIGGRFLRVPMVLHQLQPGRDSESVEQLEYQLFTTPLLVLDDIGAERDQATDYTRRTLLMVYEERGDRGLRTIFTSNKTVQELGAMQDDDRLSSRIAGRADSVKLTTPDQRNARRAK